MGIFNWFQKDVNRTPTDLHEAQTLHLLVRLVKRIDDQQQTLVRQSAHLDKQQQAMEELVKHVVDQNDRIIAVLLPPGT